MNTVERTIAAEMARPIPGRLCEWGCGLPVHRGHCKGEDRFAVDDGVRKCGQAKCANRLSISNPGPLCRTCQQKALNEGIAARELQAVKAERPKLARNAQGVLEVRPGRVQSPPPSSTPAPTQTHTPKPAAAAGVRTVRIEAIPKSAENRLDSEMGELFARLMVLGDGEALMIPRESSKQLRNTCERLRGRLKNARAGNLRWKRDGMTLYVWRDPGHGAGPASQ